MKKLIIFISICWIFNSLNSQNFSTFESNTYDKGIKSVQTIVNGIITSIPVLRLGSGDFIALQFDDTENREIDLYYKIVHCDKNWQLSNINELDYLDGFNNEQIREWQNSLNTKVDFIHYWLEIPNRDTKLKISGNYALIVYAENDLENPLFVRRFIVTEGLVNGDVKWVRPTNTFEINSGQQMNLSLLVKNYKFVNPLRDVSLTIVQNGNWNNALKNIAARNVKDNFFTFDNFGGLSFSGQNEFRWFDTRSLRSRGFGVKHIDNYIDGSDVLLDLQKPRLYNYFFNYDFNGNYYIDNIDVINRKLLFDYSHVNKNSLAEFRDIFSYYDVQKSAWNNRDEGIRSDYSSVIFSFASPKLNEDLYIYGAFTDFQLKPEFKMKYDDVKQIYIGKTMLKQGYYDYAFATAGKEGKTDFSHTEGKFQDTENAYRIIIYLSEFATRYDRVIGVITTDSSYFGSK